VEDRFVVSVLEDSHQGVVLLARELCCMIMEREARRTGTDLRSARADSERDYVAVQG
jgi:hypothetical protein